MIIYETFASCQLHPEEYTCRQLQQTTDNCETLFTRPNSFEKVPSRRVLYTPGGGKERERSPQNRSEAKNRDWQLKQLKQLKQAREARRIFEGKRKTVSRILRVVRVFLCSALKVGFSSFNIPNHDNIKRRVLLGWTFWY